MDRLTRERRSWLMSRIRGKDTKPEMQLRSLIHRMGYRFRLHRADLAGKPDLVFPSRKKAIFVHGCFWHGHYCKRKKMPKSRMEFWTEKISSNRRRDIRARRSLACLGWSSLVVWECQIKRPDTRVRDAVVRFLNAD